MASLPIDLSGLFTSNDAPEPREESLVKLNIENLLVKISETQQLEKNLLIQVSQARTRLLELENDLRQHQRVLSSIRRVPAEILGEIFELSLPSRTMTAQDRAWIITLCLVCKDWCIAARLTRSLWSSSEIDVDLVRMSFDRVAAWLQRAGDTSRSITYRTRRKDAFPDPQFVKLLAEGPILQHLSLDMESRSFKRLLHSLKSYETGKPLSWDSIASMGVDFIWWDDYGRISGRPPSVFDGIPRSVTSFQFKYYCSRGQPNPRFFVHPIRHFPEKFLERLKSFSIRYPIPFALQHCVNVETLTIDLNCATSEWIGDYLTPRSPRPVLVFPRLHTLCISRTSVTSQNPARKVIQSLRMPSLTTLKISEGNVELCQEIARLVSPSDSKVPQVNACSVLHLVLDKTSCTARMLRSVLRDFPLLTYLTFQSGHFQTRESSGAVDILESLQDTTLVPQLITLELLRLKSPDYVNLLHLPQLIEVRSQPKSSSPGQTVSKRSPGCLREVVVTYSLPSQTPAPQDKALLQELRSVARSRGVVVRVGSELLC